LTASGNSPATGSTPPRCASGTVEPSPGNLCPQ
jgi:hypothetical protein